MLPRKTDEFEVNFDAYDERVRLCGLQDSVNVMHAKNPFKSIVTFCELALVSKSFIEHWGVAIRKLIDHSKVDKRDSSPDRFQNYILLSAPQHTLKNL